MKLTSESQLPSVLSEDLKEKNFGILANEKMFGILSSKIYSDKVLAPIRELSCNAYDANVEAGKGDVPIKVHIPTNEEPWFSVEDCGSGMDAHDIEDLYTTYGYSSKTETNSLIGCLGLGSKSPFAYTDRFSVTSRKNSTEFFYQCMIENSMPKLLKFDETPSSKPSGTKVEFEVKPWDIFSFQSKCSRFYQNFSPAPEFTGDFKLDLTPFTFDKDGFYLSDDFCSNGVLMGNVIYYYQMDDFMKDEEYSEFVQVFRRVSTIVKADIGDVDVTVSRESVEMTKKSKDFIASIHMRHLENVTREFNSITPEGINPLDFVRKIYDLGRFNRFVTGAEIDRKISLCDIDLGEDTPFLQVTNDNGVVHRVLRTRKTFSFSKRLIEGDVMFVKEDYDKPIVTSFMDGWVRLNKRSCLVVFLSDKLKEKLENVGVEVVGKDHFGTAMRAVKAKLSKSKEYLGIYKACKGWGDKPLGMRFDAIEDDDPFDLADFSHVYYVRIFNKTVMDSEVQAISDGCNIQRPLFLSNYSSPLGTVIVGLNNEAYEKHKSDPKFSSYVDYLNERFSQDKLCYQACRSQAIQDFFKRKCYPLTLIDPDLLDVSGKTKQLLRDSLREYEGLDEEELFNFKESFDFEDMGSCLEAYEEITGRYWIFHALMKTDFDYSMVGVTREALKENLEKMIESLNNNQQKA